MFGNFSKVSIQSYTEIGFFILNFLVARSSSNIWANAATRSACCCRLGRWLLRDSGALEGEGAEENVVYCIPSKRTGYIALRDSSLGREEDVFRS